MSKKVQTSIFVWVLFFQTQLVFGKTLELKDILASVQQNYPVIKGFLKDLEKADAENLNAKGQFDHSLKAKLSQTPQGEYSNRYYDIQLSQPTNIYGLELFAGYRKSGGDFAVYDGKFVTNDEGEGRLGVLVPILKNGWTDERRTRLASTELGVQASRAGYDLSKIEFCRQASHRYWDWVGFGLKLKVARDLRRLAEERDDALHHRVKSGDAALIEKTDNARSIEQRRFQEITARRQLEKSALELSLFYRDSRGQPILTTEEEIPQEIATKDDGVYLDIKNRTKIDEKIYRTHPEWKRAYYNSEQAKVEFALSKNQLLPKLDLIFDASKDYGSGSNKKEVTEYRGQLVLEFPLLFRSPIGKFNSSAAAMEKFDILQDFTRDRILQINKDSISALIASDERIQAAQKELEFSQKVENGEKVKFRHGDSTIFMINQREQATADAQNRKIDALVEFKKSIVDYNASVGRF